MNWKIAILGVYALRCGSCRRVALRFGYDSALSTCYHHDDNCPAQVRERIAGSPSKVDSLIDAWREADSRYGRLNGRWPLVRLVMWPAALVAMILLATGSAALVPVLLTLAGLLAAGAHFEQLHRADAGLAKAWDNLAHYTGLSGAELVRLVRDDDEEAE